MLEPCINIAFIRGVNSIRFLDFWQKPGYPGSLFWVTGIGTGTPVSYRPVPVVLGLVTGFRVLDLKNQLNYNFLIKNYTINHVNLGGEKEKKKLKTNP
jgi:hypothetical protein